MGRSDDDRYLMLALQAAVPLWIEQHRETTVEARHARARQLADIIASEGDNIQFRGAKPGKSAEAFNALAEGLAIASFQPGGVVFRGDRWEARRLV